MAKKGSKKVDPLETLYNELMQSIDEAIRDAVAVAYDEGFVAGEDEANAANKENE